MSYGFTGLVFAVTATRFHKTVTIRFREEYETHSVRTVKEGVEKRLKFKSRWLAQLYMTRINRQQYNRYKNTDFHCGFSKTV